MSESSATKVVTAHLPEELAGRLDRHAADTERSRAWVVKRALESYLDWEDEKDRLTLEALADADARGTIPHEEIVDYFDALLKGLKPDRPTPRKS
jgi:predicted transcriptional regulator